MKKRFAFGFLATIAACGELPQGGASDVGVAPAPTNDDLRLVRGYRSEDDWCQLTGETAFTVDFLDHTADLVSCPSGSEAVRSLVDTFDARLVAQTGGYSVYTIPRG